MKQFLDKVAKTGESIVSKFNTIATKEQIQHSNKDKLIPIYELLADYE